MTQIQSNGTGGGNWNAGTTWQGGVVPTTQDWDILGGDTVVVNDAETVTGHGYIGDTIASASDPPAVLDIQEGGCLTCCNLTHAEYGIVRMAANTILVVGSLTQQNKAYLWGGGDLIMQSGATILGIADGGYFLPEGYGGDARTITVRDVQNIQLQFAGGNSYWANFGPNDGYGYNSPDPFLVISFDSAPGGAVGNVSNIDLNFVAPGATVTDYGLPWNANSSAGFPLVWAILNGEYLDVQISIYTISSTQWQWSFVLPSDTPIGSNLLVTTQWDDGSGNQFQQQFRATVQGPWITAGTGAGQINPDGGAVPASNLPADQQTAILTQATTAATQSTTAATQATAAAGSATTAATQATTAATQATSAATQTTAGNIRGAVGMAAANLDTQIGTLATPTNITAGTITNVTNLTNAPTAGDFTTAMKTSLNASTPSVSGLTTAQATQLANLAKRFCGAGGAVTLDLAAETLTVKNADGSTAYTQSFTVTPVSQTFNPAT